jgi:hypothetical protein
MGDGVVHAPSFAISKFSSASAIEKTPFYYRILKIEKITSRVDKKPQTRTSLSRRGGFALLNPPCKAPEHRFVPTANTLKKLYDVNMVVPA